jgi:hypothetical protein
MPIKKVAHLTKMARKGTKKQALNWVPSSSDQTDLTKAKKEGFCRNRRWSSSPATSELLNHQWDIG